MSLFKTFRVLSLAQPKPRYSSSHASHPNSREFGQLRRVDFHHHFFPDFTDHLFSESYSREVGWIFPDDVFPWTPEYSLRAMDTLNIQFSILSLTGSPSPTGECSREANRAFARRLNEYAADISAKYPRRFGFFANIPTPNNAEGSTFINIYYRAKENFKKNYISAAKEEIAYAIDKLGALGINLTSSYDTGSGVGASNFL